MSILDKTKIGDSVQINLELSKDRLAKEVVDALNVSSESFLHGFQLFQPKT